MSALLVMVAAPVIIGVVIGLVRAIKVRLSEPPAPPPPKRSRSMATEVRHRDKIDMADVYEYNPDDSLLTLSDDELAEMCPF